MLKLKTMISLWILLIGACGAVGVLAAQERDVTTLTGKLTRVAGIGGESTGWAVLLDSEITIRNKSIKSIEVRGQIKEFEEMDNKHVEAKGKIIFRHGIERSEWPVLEVSSLKGTKAK